MSRNGTTVAIGPERFKTDVFFLQYQVERQGCTKEEEDSSRYDSRDCTLTRPLTDPKLQSRRSSAARRRSDHAKRLGCHRSLNRRSRPFGSRRLALNVISRRAKRDWRPMPHFCTTTVHISLVIEKMSQMASLWLLQDRRASCTNRTVWVSFLTKHDLMYVFHESVLLK